MSYDSHTSFWPFQLYHTYTIFCYRGVIKFPDHQTRFFTARTKSCLTSASPFNGTRMLSGERLYDIVHTLYEQISRSDSSKANNQIRPSRASRSVCSKANNHTDASLADRPYFSNKWNYHKSANFGSNQTIRQERQMQICLTSQSYTYKMLASLAA